MFGGGLRGWGLGLIVLGACQASAECWLVPRTFDVARLQQQVVEFAAKVGLTASTVDCGDTPRPVLNDARFTCNVRFTDGQVAPIDVHITGVDGSYDWKVKHLVDVAGIAGDITASSKQKSGLDVRVTCPFMPIGVHARGETVTCALTDPAGTKVAAVRLTVEDDLGTAYWKIVAP